MEVGNDPTSKRLKGAISHSYINIHYKWKGIMISENLNIVSGLNYQEAEERLDKLDDAETHCEWLLNLMESPEVGYLEYGDMPSIHCILDWIEDEIEATKRRIDELEEDED